MTDFMMIFILYIAPLIIDIFAILYFAYDAKPSEKIGMTFISFFPLINIVIAILLIMLFISIRVNSVINYLDTYGE